MRPRPGGSGTVYRPTGRDGQQTRWYWLRYRVPEPAQTNPLILHRLAAQKIGVVTLAEVARSLEDVYLQIVESVDGMKQDA